MDNSEQDIPEEVLQLWRKKDADELYRKYSFVNLPYIGRTRHDLYYEDAEHPYYKDAEHPGLTHTKVEVFRRYNCYSVRVGNNLVSSRVAVVLPRVPRLDVDPDTRNYQLSECIEAAALIRKRSVIRWYNSLQVRFFDGDFIEVFSSVIAQASRVICAHSFFHFR